jgi:hypothetical protein
MNRAFRLPLNQSVGIVKWPQHNVCTCPLFHECTERKVKRKMAVTCGEGSVSRYCSADNIGRETPIWVLDHVKVRSWWPLTSTVVTCRRKGTKFIYKWIRTTERGQRPVWCAAASAVVNRMWSWFEYCTKLYQLMWPCGFEWMKHRKVHLFVELLTILY